MLYILSIANIEDFLNTELVTQNNKRLLIFNDRSYRFINNKKTVNLETIKVNFNSILYRLYKDL